MVAQVIQNLNDESPNNLIFRIVVLREIIFSESQQRKFGNLHAYLKLRVILELY